MERNVNQKRTEIRCPNCDCQLRIEVDKIIPKDVLDLEKDIHLQIADELKKDYAVPKDNGGKANG